MIKLIIILIILSLITVVIYQNNIINNIKEEEKITIKIEDKDSIDYLKTKPVKRIKPVFDPYIEMEKRK